MRDIDVFLEAPFSLDEVKCAVNKLHKKKAPGIDGITTEHIIHAGRALLLVLVSLYNCIVKMEYVPENLRRGIQVPLFKGKNLCSLDVNNYRGITVLTNFNKIFEILIWNRVHPGGRGGHSGTEGGRTFVTYFAEEGVFF